VLNTLQVALVIHMMFYYMIDGHGSPTFLSHLVWSFSLELGVTIVVTFVVRTLYMKQLWQLSDHNAWLVVPAFVFAAGQLALGIQTMATMLIHPTIAIVTTKSFQWMLGSKCAASVLADVIITCSMCYFLHASRTGIQKTNDLVKALLIYTINRGVLAMLMETAVMITFLIMKHNYVFAALHLMLGKLHTSSFFALLLQRESLRSQQNRNTSHFSRVPTSPDTQRSPHFSHLLHDHSTEFGFVVTRQTMTVEHTFQSDDFREGPICERRDPP